MPPPDPPGAVVAGLPAPGAVVAGLVWSWPWDPGVAAAADVDGADVVVGAAVGVVAEQPAAKRSGAVIRTKAVRFMCPW